MTTTDASPSRRPSALARVVLALVRVYQATAALRAPRCRFHPTCSQYAVESIETHGALRGTAFGLGRVARCHPWHPGGVDPVKPRKS